MESRHALYLFHNQQPSVKLKSQMTANGPFSVFFVFSTNLVTSTPKAAPTDKWSPQPVRNPSGNLSINYHMQLVRVLTDSQCDKLCHLAIMYATTVDKKRKHNEK